MSRANLTLFKEKHNTSIFFVNVAESLLDKLVEFEYIPSFKLSKYEEILLGNIKNIRFGKNAFDYKSGFYDANKKELYIKDEKNIPSVYLRLLYALTTKQLDETEYMTGYSNVKMRKDSYKLDYMNFGINRAVTANLVYKLCNLVPANFQIVPVEKTYTHDFLGFKIESLNDMYSLEGKLLAQTCFVLDIDPEILYSGLFSKNPIKYIYNVFAKKEFQNKDEFLALFDNISRKYNTYNKLCFLSQKLNNNYIEYKKNVLAKDTSSITKEQEIIEQHIMDVIASINENIKYDETFEFVTGLAETLEKLEFEIKELLIQFQDILADNLININSHMPYAKYTSKLKCFNDMLIIPNNKITKTIQDIILLKLMPLDEVTGINLVQKIKYALIEKVLSDKNYADISNTFSFYNVTNFENTDVGSTIIVLNSAKNFAKIVEVKGLNSNISASHNFELNFIALDNLKYAINSNFSTISIENIESIYTALKNSFEELKNIPLDNISSFEYENKNYLVVNQNTKPYVIEYKRIGTGYNFTLLNLSEQYKVFGTTKLTANTISSLPTLYKK